MVTNTYHHLLKKLAVKERESARKGSQRSLYVSHTARDRIAIEATDSVADYETLAVSTLWRQETPFSEAHAEEGWEFRPGPKPRR